MIGVGTTIFLVNPTTFPSGFTNDYSLLFDGVDEYVTCGNILALQSVQNLSYSCWVKFNSITNTKHFMGAFNGTTSGTIMGTYSTDKVRYYQLGGTGSTSYSYGETTTGFTTGVWYHLAFTFDGTQTGNLNRMKIYINGTSDTLTFNGTIGSTTDTNAWNWILGSSIASSYFSNVYLDEVAIFDYTLSSTQVTDIYNSGVPTDLDNTSGVTAPVHWWRMGDGDTFPTITDVGSTGGNNGTMTNGEAGDIVSDVPS